MSLCQHCQTEIYTESIAGVRNLRCASCGGLNTLVGKATSKNQNRDAWFSFWLGLSSLVMSCLTGIPAVYFGIRALGKMRYQPTSRRAELAAFAGIFLGGIVGTLFIGMFLFLATIGGVIGASSDEASDPIRTVAMTESLGTFDVESFPEFKVRKAIKLYKMFQFAEWTNDRLEWHWLEEEDPRAVYRWGEDKRSARVSVAVFPNWVGNNQMQIKNMLRDTYLKRRERRRKTGSETLMWTYLGSETKVTHNSHVEVLSEDEMEKEIKNKKAPGQIELYFCSKIVDSRTHSFAVAHNPDKSNLSEDDIQQIFASYEPSNKTN